MKTHSPTISRRKLLASSLALAGSSLMLKGARSAQAEPETPRHLVWIWQFSDDGEPDAIGRRLLDAGLGLVIKSHDGARWMSEFDESPYAVTGAAQVAVLSNYYESAGIPLHAWAVVTGKEAVLEAQMASDVLAGGARSIYLNLQAKDGFWQGDGAAAVTFGTELRRLQPDAQLILCLDPRPWTREGLPVAEFAAFCNGIALQDFWRDFDTEADTIRFAEAGTPPPAEGITPEFLVGLGDSAFADFNRPITHIGQGGTPDAAEFQRFIDANARRPVSAWRYKDIGDEVFAVLAAAKPATAETSSTPPVEAPKRVHVVVSGDTLTAIAAEEDVSLEALVAINKLSDPDAIVVGQELILP